AVIATAALIGNALVPQDPFVQDLGNRLKPPFWMDGSDPAHLFGTDQLGRDYLARLIYGARISLLIGIMTVITSGLIGITLGVVGTLEMALAILLEAALSFLGLGVPPPLPSWGLMIAEGKDYMFFSPWVIFVPGVALFTLVLGINLVGDGLRNLLGTERLR